MRFWRRWLGGERGQSLVELAVTLPVLIALLFGSISFILAAQGKVVVTNAARNAGRTAAIECGKGNSNWGVEAKDMAERVLRDGSLAVERFAPLSQQGTKPGTWYVTATCSGTGGYVTLTVEYAQVNLFPPLMWFLNNQRGGTFYFPFRETVTYPVE